MASEPPPSVADEPQLKQPPPLAAKANDLEALRTAVVDAANVGAGLWVSYLFVLFYMLVAAGGVTHKDMFFESPVRLPFLNVDLPLTGFFWLGPTLFLIVHAYVLLHFGYGDSLLVPRGRGWGRGSVLVTPSWWQFAGLLASVSFGPIGAEIIGSSIPSRSQRDVRSIWLLLVCLGRSSRSPLTRR